jgi:hypothetical protein
MSLVAFALSVAAVVAIIIGLVSLYTRRVADVALTDPFRAAETIVNGRIPDRWVLQINRRLALPRVLRGHVTGTELALAKIDKLVRFYANSPFFENDRARELLLAQLQDTRARWAGSTWDDVVAQYGGGRERAS